MAPNVVRSQFDSSGELLGNGDIHVLDAILISFILFLGFSKEMEDRNRNQTLLLAMVLPLNRRQHVTLLQIPLRVHSSGKHEQS